MAGGHVDMQADLARRINLQISLSSLPVVEEWMDTKLSRWLESVPVAAEFQGEAARLLVELGADLQRLVWSASGHPMAMIPKLSEYLQSCQVTPEEVGVIDALGNGLEPDRMGSWIEVRGAELFTGWQFLDRETLADVQAYVGEAWNPVFAWFEGNGADAVTRIASSIGDQRFLEIEVGFGGTAAEGLAAAILGFEEFGAQLSEPLREALTASGADGPAFSVRVEGGAVTSMQLTVRSLPLDVVAHIAGAAGVELDPNLGNVQRVLLSKDLAAVHLRNTGGELSMAVSLVPSAVQAVSPAKN